MALLLSLLGIALVDSLNPSAILMTLYLLSTERPLARTLSYLSGILVTYLGLGIAAYFGLGTLMRTFLAEALKPHPLLYGLETLAGMLLIVSGIRMSNSPGERDVMHLPTKLAPASSTFGLGVGITVVEFSTAAPYLGAIALLSKTDLSAVQALGLLVLYNIVFVWIPLLLILIHRLRGQASQRLMQKLSERINAWSSRVLRWVLIALGLGFMADALYGFTQRLMPW